MKSLWLKNEYTDVYAIVLLPLRYNIYDRDNEDVARIQGYYLNMYHGV